MNKKLLASALSLAMLLSSTAALAEEIGDLPESDEPLVTDTWGYEWNFNTTSTWTTPSWSDPAVEGDTASYAQTGATNTNNFVGPDASNAKLITSTQYGNGGTTNCGKPSSFYGSKIVINDANGAAKTLADTEVLVSTDFMVPHDDIGGYILTPQSSKNIYNYTMAFSVELDGTMKMVNGCRWGGDDGFNVTIGKVTYGEWYNLMIKYKFQSSEGSGLGMRADVYLNGELVVPDFAAAYNGGGAVSFVNPVIAKDRHRFSTYDPFRSHGVDEGIVFDNVYVGNDMSRIPTETAIARVYDGNATDKTKLNVRFTKDVKDTLTAADFSVYTATGEAAATVNAIEWLDNREAVLTLSAELALYTDYIVAVTGNINKTFKTKLEKFWDFEDGTATGFVLNPRNGNSRIEADGTDSYNPTGKGARVWFGGKTASGAGTVIRESAAASVVSADKISAYNGPIMVNTDIMIPNERVIGGIVVGGQTYQNLKGSVSIRHTFDGEGTYTGTNLYVGDTVLKTGLELKKWYNLAVKMTELSANYAAIDQVYLDGEALMSASVNIGNNITERIMLLGQPNMSAAPVSDQIAFYDNVYIGQNLNYTNSKSTFNTTDGLNWTVSAGAKKNAGTMLVAVYDADTGALKEVKSAKFDVDPMESADATIALTDTTGTMKLFTWDNVEGLKPFVSPNAAFVTVE